MPFLENPLQDTFLAIGSSTKEGWRPGRRLQADAPRSLYSFDPSELLLASFSANRSPRVVVWLADCC